MNKKIYWLAKNTLALLCAVAATAFAQNNSGRTVTIAPATLSTATIAAGPSDPQTELMTVVEPKYERDPTGLSPLGDDFSPATGTVTFSATDISIPGNFAIPVELRRWVPSEDADTGGPTGWKWNIPFIRGNYLDVKDGHSSTGWNWGNADAMGGTAPAVPTPSLTMPGNSSLRTPTGRASCCTFQESPRKPL